MWYRRWLSVCQAIKMGNKEEALELMFNFTNQGFNYNWIAYSAAVSLELAKEDCLYKACSECEHRFTCFTESRRVHN